MMNLSVTQIRERTKKKRATIIGIGIATSIIFLRLITDITLKQSIGLPDYITLSCVLVLLSLIVYIHKSRDYQRALFIILLVSFVLVYLRTSVTGGLSSSSSAWYPTLPMVAAVLLSRMKTYIVCAVAMFFVFLTSQFPLTYFAEIQEQQLSSVSMIITYLCIVLVSTFFSLDHERKKKEELLQVENKKVNILSSSRNIELGELAAGIAHEINNPLTVVMLKAKKILESPEHQDSAEKIILMTERISKIVNSMKNLSTPEEDIEGVSNITYDYIEENVLALCETRMSDSEIDFKIFNSIENINQYKLPIQLGHIFLSLINNAYDAVQSVESKWINLNIGEDKGLLIFKISDNGPGIPKDKSLNIFNPFYTDKSKKTGLGLSISRNNLMSLGGELTLDIKEKNTTFVITLPAILREDTPVTK